MRKFILLTTLFCVSFSSYAQNYIYDLNQSGFALDASVALPEDSTVYGITPSFTWDGKLTAGVGLFEDSAKDFDESATSFIPYINYLFVKKELSNNILNIGVNSSYQFTNYSQDSDLKSSVFNIGLGASMKFNHEADFNFTLGSQVSWGRLNLTYNDFDESENLTQYGFYGNFLFEKFYVQPAISFVKILDETNSSFSISVGYIFDNNQQQESTTPN